MNFLLLVVFLGLLLSPAVIKAESKQNSRPKCQQLAYDFSENPDSLNGERLKQLQFCINQTLAKRENTNPPTMLKGTIIEPIVPSTGNPLPDSTTPPNQD